MKTLVIGSLGWPKDETGNVVRVDIVPEWADCVCDITKGIPLEDESFDDINCSHILEHIQLNDDYKFVWNEMYRLLKPDGLLYVEVPHKDTNMAYECWSHCRWFINNSFTAFYNNPYYKQEGLPQFKLVSLSNGKLNGEKTIQLWLKK
jgi:predicted SAM-dependent methyltransferase